MNQMWQPYPSLVQDLKIVEEDLLKVHKSSGQYLNESMDYLMMTGGKMLRPALALIGFGFGKKTQKTELYTMATAIETLHLATLIHDDVIDDAEKRRGYKTIQSKYGKHYAVYMGDYMLTQAFMMLSQHAYSQDHLKALSRGISKICLGELRQNKHRFDPAIGRGDYLRIIAGKTAGLLGLSLAVGGGLGQVDDKIVKKLAKIGFSMGMAFQLKDDLLDYQGQAHDVGKDVLSDLYNGYYTLPVIIALKEEPELLMPFLRNQGFLKANINEALAIIRGTSGIKKTEDLCEKYSRRALKLVDELPACQSKTILHDLILKLLYRHY